MDLEYVEDTASILQQDELIVLSNDVKNSEKVNARPDHNLSVNYPPDAC